MSCRLLIVDDDFSVLQALRREFLRKPDIGFEEIEIETFQRAEEALARAAQPDGFFDAAIVDYRLKDMSGIAFLEHFRRLQPETARILLTGLIDMDGAIGAINNAHVDHVIAKPWHEYDLKGRLALALHQRVLSRNIPTPRAAGAAQTFRLLIVDDETPQLQALTRELSLHGKATRGTHPLLEIYPANSPNLALIEAVTHCPDIAIVDYAMPEMNGIELLGKLRELCPHCVRILLSGHADTAALVAAINTVGVYHFVGKPWDAMTLRSTLAEAMTYRDLLRATEVGTTDR